MPVNVNEIVSNVVPEPEPANQGDGREPDWQHAARMREIGARLNRDQWRTAAGGFDD